MRKGLSKDIVLDEEGLVCSRCGKDIWHCKCQDELAAEKPPHQAKTPEVGRSSKKEE